MYRKEVMAKRLEKLIARLDRPTEFRACTAAFPNLAYPYILVGVGRFSSPLNHVANSAVRETLVLHNRSDAQGKLLGCTRDVNYKTTESFAALPQCRVTIDCRSGENLITIQRNIS